jgi:hypothetical protein
VPSGAVATLAGSICDVETKPGEATGQITQTAAGLRVYVRGGVLAEMVPGSGDRAGRRLRRGPERDDTPGRRGGCTVALLADKTDRIPEVSPFQKPPSGVAGEKALVNPANAPIHDAAESTKKWLTPVNVIALIGVLTAPGMLSLYQSWAATKTVNESLLIVATGVEEFGSNTSWVESQAIRGWQESNRRVRFRPPVPCDQPDVRVAVSSFDLGTATRLDVAAPDNERHSDGFLLAARTWGGSTEIPWVKVDWFAACRGTATKRVSTATSDDK